MGGSHAVDNLPTKNIKGSLLVLLQVAYLTMSLIRQLCEAWAPASQIFSLLLLPVMKSSGSVKGVCGLGTCTFTGLCL